jgi:cell wall-associated NlpC family hydrolase
MLKKILTYRLFFLSFFLPCTVLAGNFPAALFPLDRYDQNITHFLSPTDPQYQKQLPQLTQAYQKARFTDFRTHLFSTHRDAASPWSTDFVSRILDKNPGLLDFVKTSLTDYSNQDKPEKYMGYGENFRPHDAAWINAIADNIDLAQFAPPIQYHISHRAIIVKNTLARMLPTHDPHFYSYEIPGQGYPFDNLQASALWVGTPVYILGKTKDGAWSLILSASFVAWIESDAVANTSRAFVARWERFTQSGLVAVTHTQSPILSACCKKFQFTAYVGSVFPFLGEEKNYFKILIPFANAQGNAERIQARIEKKYAAKMPLAATPENFSKLIQTLQNRPYGWGGSYFYNDCSAELQNLYTPFGIWLPRNSSQQNRAGKMIDLQAMSAEKRLAYLMQNGHPLTTIVHINGHVFMYLGNYPNPADHTPMVMSYQNVWGLSPEDGSRRAVIGQSVLLPLLNHYPEDTALNPLTNRQYFQVIYLDQWPDKTQEKMTDLFF